MLRLLNQSKVSSAVLLLLLCIAYAGKAGTISGADLTYKQVGPLQYEVTLHYYFNCVSIGIPPTNAPVNIFSENCGITEPVQYLPIIFSESGDEIDGFCTELVNAGFNTACNGGSYQGIKLYTYRAVITLPAYCPDWRIGFKHGTRFEGSTNLQNPEMYSLYIEALINNTSGLVNSSPQFLAIPTPFFCNSTANYDHGYSEEDSDSLLFSIINPLSEYNVAVPYAPGYSNQLPLSASAFSIDSQSGVISFTPTGEQVAALQVLVSEYRNGYLIGFTMRSLQFTVSDCTSDGMLLSPNSNTETSVCANTNYQISFNITGVDELAAIGDLENIPAANFTTDIDVNGNGTAYFAWTPATTDTGKHYLILKGTNRICPYTTEQFYTFSFTVHPNPTIILNNALSVCENYTVPISVEILSPISTYEWSPSTGLNCADCPNPILTAQNNTTYSLTATDIFNCKTVAYMEVNVLSAPVVDAGLDMIVFEGETPYLNATGNFESIVWEPASGLSNANISNPSVSTDTSASYIAEVTALNGCTATDTVKVIVKKCDDLLIPNAFSPNGDGVNDLFKVTEPIMEEGFKMVIYDRWGNQIFFSDKVTEGWDGTQNGSYLPMGLYAYYCDYKCGNKILQTKGYVTIIK